MKKVKLFGREIRCLSNALYYMGLPQRSMKQVISQAGSLDDYVRNSFPGKTDAELLALYDKRVKEGSKPARNTPEEYAGLCAALKEIVGEAKDRYDGKVRELLDELHCDNPLLAARRIEGRFYVTEKRKRERQFR